MRLLATAFTVFALGSVSAQDYTFKVLINKGQNAVRKGDDWFPVKVGVSLKSGDELKVSPNGYLGLVHHSGKPLEVKDSGEHSVADLAGKIKGGSSVLNKYTDFILSTKIEEESNLVATGAVYRGSGEIKVYLPKPPQAVVFNDEVSIAWAKHPKSGGYIVQFNSMFGDALERLTARDTAISIDLSSTKFAHEDNIVMKVISAEDDNITSDDFVLKKLSPADKKRITTSLRELESVLAEENALNLLFLASFYEDNALYIDAATAYQRAIRLEPQVPDYQDAYQQFVLRNELKN